MKHSMPWVLVFFCACATSAWSKEALTPEALNRRNGEQAYRIAYSSFQEGQPLKKNKTEALVGRGRWVKKITTWHEIVFYRDMAGNTAIETSDGKWHIINSSGSYVHSKIELPIDLGRKTGRSLASILDEPKPSSNPTFDNPLLPK